MVELKGRRILIVEDDPFLALDLELWLQERFDATVSIAPSVVAAHDALKSHFDFVILDVNVTDGSTFEFARHLRKVDTPFIFVCGHPRDQFPADLKQAPYVSKPWAPERLIDTITSHFAGRPTKAGGAD